ncbi:MAG: cation diffusion facilitator family transporter [uncultured bacterium]|nr:MAG: cation diffusion facilitator family transporter [uncultured bacterium]
MHKENLELWQHHHLFNADKTLIEKRTFIVVMVTFVTMILEIFFGLLSNSIALLADGWHMGTHTLALGVSLYAFITARKYSKDHSFTFGTWKIEILGAYTSAIVLGIVGGIMIFSSAERILNPKSIYYSQALIVALLGLIVNLVCALILNVKGHSHKHNHSHAHDEHSHELHDDLNLKSAYLHVLADAATSVLAIIALLGAKYFRLNWLDPFMGFVGAGLILRWSFLLLKDTGSILLDREFDNPIAMEIKNEIEADGDSKICDLHIWRVAQNKFACIISLVTAKDFSIDEYKSRLSNIHELVHVSLEINKCGIKTQ